MPLRCDHCGHSATVPCWACRQGLSCIGLCWDCQVAEEEDPFDTDELPLVHVHPDGSASFSGDPPGDDEQPEPDADLPPLPASDIPF